MTFDSSLPQFSFAELFRDNRFSGADRVGDANQLSAALTTKFINDSGEELLSARCAAIHNQNLELHLKNTGDKPITIVDGFTLENNTETHKVFNLFPPWRTPIDPGRSTAYYCSIDENLWKKFTTIIIIDTNGNEYRFPTT